MFSSAFGGGASVTISIPHILSRGMPHFAATSGRITQIEAWSEAAHRDFFFEFGLSGWVGGSAGPPGVPPKALWVFWALSAPAKGFVLWGFGLLPCAKRRKVFEPSKNGSPGPPPPFGGWGYPLGWWGAVGGPPSLIFRKPLAAQRYVPLERLRAYTVATDSFLCASFDAFPAFFRARYPGETAARLSDGTCQSRPRAVAGVLREVEAGVVAAATHRGCHHRPIVVTLQLDAAVLHHPH